MNLDGRKPDNIPQDQWDRMKEVFNEIYEDDNMERLTNEPFSCMRDFCSHTECELYADCPAIAKHNRLCAYEDTGLTPEQVAAQKWIPVSERLPEVGRSVIVYNAPAKCASEAVYKGEGKFLQFRWAARLQEQEVTHWMPLPMPPEVN